MSNALKTMNTVLPYAIKLAEAKRAAAANTEAQPSVHWMAPTGLILSFVMPLVGLIISIIAMAQIQKSGLRGSGMAIAGISLGAIGFLAQIFFGGMFFLLLAIGK